MLPVTPRRDMWHPEVIGMLKGRNPSCQLRGLRWNPILFYVFVASFKPLKCKSPQKQIGTGMEVRRVLSQLIPLFREREIAQTKPYALWGFPDATVGKESACSAGDTGYVGLIPESGRSPGEGNGKFSPVFLPREFHGQRSLAGYSPLGYKESDTTEQLSMAWHGLMHFILKVFR